MPKRLFVSAFGLLFSCCNLLPGFAQSSDKHPYGELQPPPLPTVHKGQPAFSFEAGKRVSVQNNRPAGMREYGAGSDVQSRNPGTGIVEMNGGNHIGRLSPQILSPANPAVPSSATSVVRDISPISVSTRSSGTKTPPSTKAKIRPATTVVQLLGPDGKMEYKEVKFCGELSANRKAPAITEVKDGEGKVKEYDWVKNKTH